MISTSALGILSLNKKQQPYQTLAKTRSNWTTYRLWVGTSLVVQWLRIRLPMQGTWVRALVREDPTCHGATKPVCHNY